MVTARRPIAHLIERKVAAGLGRANWWAPRPLRRLHARFGTGGAEAPARPAPEPART